MKKGNSLLLIVILLVLVIVVQNVELHKSNKIKRESNLSQKFIEIKNKSLKSENKRLRRISMMLFNYADYRDVKRDTALINEMVRYTETQD